MKKYFCVNKEDCKFKLPKEIKEGEEDEQDGDNAIFRQTSR